MPGAGLEPACSEERRILSSPDFAICLPGRSDPTRRSWPTDFNEGGGRGRDSRGCALNGVIAPLNAQALVWKLVRRQHGVISHAQLLSLGFTAEAIRHRIMS